MDLNLRGAAIYRLFVMPGTFASGSFLPFDQGLVTCGYMPTADGTKVLLAHQREPERSFRLKRVVLLDWDHCGIMLDGLNAEGVHERWRLEALRPGVGDWRSIYENQELSAKEPPPALSSYFVDERKN